MTRISDDQPLRVYEASLLLTMEEPMSLVAHSLVVSDGRILDLLPWAQGRAQYPQAEFVDLKQLCLMPGLINAHGHAPMALLRGVADDLPLEQWLTEAIWPLESALLSPDFVYQGSQLAIAEMLHSGITCYSDHYFFPQSGIDAALDAGIRAQFSFPILDFANPWSQNAEHALQQGQALMRRHQHHDRLRVVYGPHAPYTLSDNSLRQLRQAMDQLPGGLHIHLHETEQEVAQSIQSHGCRPLARLQGFGLIQRQSQLVHMCALTPEDIRAVAESQAAVIHCPESNLKLASGFCPVHQLQQAGVVVALGTDGAASNNDLDLWGEMKTAALLAKAVAKDARALNAVQALRMATIEGAKALGWEADIGSLAIGKQADFIAVDYQHWQLSPCYQPCSQLVYAGHKSLVRHLWVAGKQLLRDQQLCFFDLDALKQQTLSWQTRISPRAHWQSTPFTLGADR